MQLLLVTQVISLLFELEFLSSQLLETFVKHKLRCRVFQRLVSALSILRLVLFLTRELGFQQGLESINLIKKLIAIGSVEAWHILICLTTVLLGVSKS